MADTQQRYIASISSGVLDFDSPSEPPAFASAPDVRSTYQRLDRELLAKLEEISDPDAVKIRRGDEDAPLFIVISSLVEALLLYHGKCWVYARLMDIPLPDTWKRYI